MTGLIILAAGESSRLGQPKQNLVFNGQTLLQRAVECGKASKCGNVIVVLGANSDAINPIQGTITLYNNDWIEGLSSSIRLAITEVEKNQLWDKVIISVCDQPFISAELLNKLIDKHKETRKPVVACTYNGIIGVPALFTRMVFPELMALQGHEGAKKIFKIHEKSVATVQFEKGSIDIDTPDDYDRLLQSGN